MTTAQRIIRALMEDVEHAYGANAALPVTVPLAQADEALRKLAIHPEQRAGEEVRRG